MGGGGIPDLGSLRQLPTEIRHSIYEYLIPSRYISRLARSLQSHYDSDAHKRGTLRVPEIVHDVALVSLLQANRAVFADVKPILERHLRSRADVLEYITAKYPDEASEASEDRQKILLNSAHVVGPVLKPFWQSATPILDEALRNTVHLEIVIRKDYSCYRTPENYCHVRGYMRKLIRYLYSANYRKGLPHLQEIRCCVDLNIQHFFERLKVDSAYDISVLKPVAVFERLSLVYRLPDNSPEQKSQSSFIRDVTFILGNFVPRLQKISPNLKTAFDFRCLSGLEWDTVIQEWPQQVHP